MRPRLPRAVFTLSLDFELIWGTLDLRGPDGFREDCLLERAQVVDRLLALFVELDVRATWLVVPRFNFNWQTLYRLSNPLALPKGTRLLVTAHFDNSARNKYNPDPTRAVRWGDPTYDEMMIGWFDMVIDNPMKPKKTMPADKPETSKAGEK